MHDASTPDTPALHPDTLAVIAGRPAKTPDQPMSVPVHLTSTYVAGGELEYGRYGNPTWTAFEETLGALEGGRCVAFASGMAAVAAVLDLVEPGGTVVAPRHSYTGTVAALEEREEQGRLRAVFVDITDTAAVAAACEGAAMVWFESPTNPALEVADIAAIARAAHEHGAATAAVSVMSTKTARRRPCSSRSWRAATVPVYECRGATTVPPGSTRSSTAATAAMPDANATHRPPSSAPRVSSNAVQVGLPYRPYSSSPPATYVEVRCTGTLMGWSGVCGGRPAMTARVSGWSAGVSGVLASCTVVPPGVGGAEVVASACASL